ncbi:hypothetical protein BTO18_04140 [Polaribacter porphyrae]|uniref:HTH LytTR-type domain-containing protein n=2 Tax=Polaribacter porphyrae TaxID=1137780 RepID=A0A2S7WLF4_9FLAO|nr:hypothetical protein BTO18_04140 [Polaribacter porphyrae]
MVFETFQQLFYIKRFNLNDSVTFFELFKNQFYRWIMWSFSGIPLLFFIYKDVHKETENTRIIKYCAIIFLSVFVNILLIASISMLSNSDSFSFHKFYSEYFLFFTFQKVPICTLGYIAVTIILFLNFQKELLEIEVQDLADIKRINQELYNKLSLTNANKAKVLSIKVGNKIKIIPVDTIIWIEADDYCANVHTKENPSYSMRASLKSLELKLSDDFLRVHRKSIVNMKMAKELKLVAKPYLLLSNNEEILVSKSNIRVVKSYMDKQ